MRARYYDPQTQQFLSRDPLGVPNQPYVYANRNPINYIDPTGTQAVPGGDEEERPVTPGQALGEEGLAVPGGGGGGGAAEAAKGAAATAGEQAEVGTVEGPLQAGEAGRFGDLAARAVTGGDLTPHHMPQARQGFASREEGGALMLPTSEHKLTRTFGRRGRLVYSQEAGLQFRQVLARDLFDIQRLFGARYNAGIRSLLHYYRTNNPNLINKVK